MKPPIDPDGQLPPVFTVVAGLPGAGKSTILDQLRGGPNFPQHQVEDAPDQVEACGEAVMRAIALNQSIVIESSCEHGGIVEWMELAVERGFDVELLIVGVDDDGLLATRHQRRLERRKLLEAIKRMSSAVDVARRVVLIDNSAGMPFVAATIDAGKVSVLDNRPAWVARRVIAPRLARQASLKAVKSSYEALSGDALVHPVLQTAGKGAAVYTGRIVAMSSHHALQQIGAALHVIHDLSLVSFGASGLALNAVASLAYGFASREAAEHSMEREQARDHEQER